MGKHTFYISRGEMIPDERDVETVKPSAIDEGGALGLWDGFGQMQIIVDGERAITIRVYRGEGGVHVTAVNSKREAVTEVIP